MQIVERRLFAKMNVISYEMKPMIRISKSGIRFLIGKMLDYGIKYEYLTELDTDACNAKMCPVYRKYQEFSLELTKQLESANPDLEIIDSIEKQIDNLKCACSATGCPNVCTKTIYYNDKKRYNLYQYNYASKRLPKSVIRTYLFLYSYPQEQLFKTTGKSTVNTHFLKNVPIELLENALGICKETAVKSLQILASFNFITLSHAASYNSYNIILTEYDTMHLSAQKGGSGYFTLTDQMLKELLAISNVNSLRLEILELLKYDDDMLHGKKISEYKIRDLKNVMPAHMNYQKKYINLLTDQPSLFHADIIDGSMRFFLKSGYSLHFDYQEYQLSFFDQIENFIKDNDINISLCLMSDICSLTHEFTLTNIQQSLLHIKVDYPDMSIISSFGALLRTYCQKNFLRMAS